MSVKNPGIIFDASSSWNGYNHQGKVALLVAIKTICRKWDKSKTIAENSELLKDYFLELEYLEDFSIGTIERGSVIYESVHQVKDRNNENLNSYDSALLGLVQHIIEKTKIEKLYLHVTTDLKTSEDELLEHLKNLVQNPNFIDTQLELIKGYRANKELRDDLFIKKCGKDAEFKKNITKFLKDLNIKKEDINSDNLEKAFNQYENSLTERKDKLVKVDEESLGKIKIYKYPKSAGAFYCSVVEIRKLILDAITEFYGLLPKEVSCRATDKEFKEKCFLYLYDKLLTHIADRDLYYRDYNQGIKDRKIQFSQIIEWLNSDEIDSHGIEYYLFHTREKILEYTSNYCKICEGAGCKIKCNLEEFRNALEKMTYEQLKNFIYITNPQVNETLGIKSYPDFVAKHAFSNYYPEGLRDIKNDLTDDEVAMIYKRSDNGEYILSTIYEDNSNDKKSICTQIVMNENINSVMMDYDGFISHNLDAPSILDAVLSPTGTEDEYDGTNITRWKNVKIIPLKDF